MRKWPKITFGIIVLNGEPFTRYCLRSLYPFGHEIIVVEGASPGGASIAAADGHSRDGTLDILRAFKMSEDADDKLTIVTAEDEGYRDGFWPGEKDEQSQAYARRATGDYLWQVDIDEFYKAEHLRSVLTMLSGDPSIAAMSFKQTTFWGDPRFVADGWSLRRGGNRYHRLFKWGPNYRYTSHRPPTVCDDLGRDLRTLHWIDAETTKRLGIRLYHYSLLFPKQVREKGEYYQHAAHSRAVAADWNRWMECSYTSLRSPFRVHNLYNLDHYPSWLERFPGDHPDEAVRMIEDIRTGLLNAEMRGSDDVDRLLDSNWYRLSRTLIKMLDYPDRLVRRARAPLRLAASRIAARLR